METGSVFVIPMQISIENSLPFGLGKVIQHEKGKQIHFQWLGNLAQSQNGKFQVAWYQDSVKKYYYKPHPIYKSHPPYTGQDLGVHIMMNDVILVDEDKEFFENGFLKPWAKLFIRGHKWVQQSINDFKEHKEDAL